MAITLLGLKEDISIKQGVDVEIEYTLTNSDGTPIDRTGQIWDVRYQVRAAYDSSSWVLNGTLANEKVKWLGTTAEFRFKIIIPDAETSAIKFLKDSPDIWTGVYDIEVVSPNSFPGTQSPWYGAFTIQREVTR